MDYKFQVDGVFCPPSDMQRYTVMRLQKQRTIGNWCGTGAGKTNSALFASRQLECHLTVVICPNSVKKDWKDALSLIYPDTNKFIIREVLRHSDLNKPFDMSKYNYLLINYDKFCDDKNVNALIQKICNFNVDFLVFDEVQMVKVRSEKTESNRHKSIMKLRTRLEENNPNLYVMGMTATPCINNLSEVRSIVELITGKEHPEISAVPTTHNVATANAVLLDIGFRFKKDFGIKVVDTDIQIRGDELLDELLKVDTSKVTDIEEILLDKKLADPMVRSKIKKGTIIYLQYKSGGRMVKKVKDCVKSLGYTCGVYSGDEDEEERITTKEQFIAGDIDVLIGTSPLSTGVNRLQEVCNRLIILSYPWTSAEYEQLIGRINRQGSKFNRVEIVHPYVSIAFPDEGNDCDKDWSYEVYRRNIIRTKRTLSDAVVDGSFSGMTSFSRNKIIKEIMDKLKECATQCVDEETPENNEQTEKAKSVIKEMHSRQKEMSSSEMADYFDKHKGEWEEYHRQRELAKKRWVEDPVDVIAGYINSDKHKDNVIADLGCGTAKLRTLITDYKMIYSVDYGISEEEAKAQGIIRADMSDLSEYIGDGEVDIAVFCLSLWNSNYEDYIKEAHRILCKRGILYIVEPINGEFNEETLEKVCDKHGLQIDNKVLKSDKENRFGYYKFIN